MAKTMHKVVNPGDPYYIDTRWRQTKSIIRGKWAASHLEKGRLVTG